MSFISLLTVGEEEEEEEECDGSGRRKDVVLQRVRQHQAEGGKGRTVLWFLQSEEVKNKN